MEEPVFLDKSQVPGEADLARALGRAKRHWDNLKAYALGADPAASPKWTYESRKAGWTFAVRGKRRNLLYLKPFDKRFTVGFAFGKKAVEAVELTDLPGRVIKMIKEAPLYPEGRAVRFQVTSAADVKIAKKLLAIKMEN